MNANESMPAKELPQFPRILVVEDDASYGELLRYQLRNEGYDPTLLRSGEEGLAKVAEIDPALVLLDVMLPGKDGREILAELHASHPELPVVMMTAAGSVEPIRRKSATTPNSTFRPLSPPGKSNTH